MAVPFLALSDNATLPWLVPRIYVVGMLRERTEGD
jgi:hypothetical protein